MNLLLVPVRLLLEPMAKRGRPSKFTPEILSQAKFLARRGCTDGDLAEFFGVSEQTINSWKTAHPDFLESIKAGKHESDTAVERSLYERAMGYSHPEDKIFQYEGRAVTVPTRKHYPPDTTACIFWLKNRKPAQWRDKVDHEHKGELELGASDSLASLMAKIRGGK